MPAPVAAALAAVGDDAPPLLRLAAVMPSLAAWDRRQPPRTRIDRAQLIIACCRSHWRQPPAPARAGDGGMAARLLRSVAGSAAADWEVAALDRVLVACAEHELNASTFAARVVASTGADLFASVLAALCSLSGPIHGGACDRIEAMFAELATGARVDEAWPCSPARIACRPVLVMRFIPTVIRAQCCSSGTPRRSRAIAAGGSMRLALKVEEAVWKRERLRPNLDFYLTVCTRMLGFPRGLPAAIFAIGARAGWIAHASSNTPTTG